MKSTTSSGSARVKAGCSRSKLRVALTEHAKMRIETRLGGKPLQLHQSPHVRVLEMWDRQTGKTVYAVLANQGSVLLGYLMPEDEETMEFRAVTMLKGHYLHVRPNSRVQDSRLIPMNSALYEVVGQPRGVSVSK
jgi:hypothetical protein